MKYHITNHINTKNGKINTDKSRMQEEAIYNENRFKSYFENNRAVMLQVDSESKKIIDVNNAAIKYYGYSKEAILKKTVYDINTLPEHKIKILMQKSSEEKSISHLFTHRLADGTVRDVEVFVSPLKVKDSIILFLTVYDITDKIIADKKLAANIELQSYILDSFDDGTYLCSSDYEILYMNPSMEKKIGFDSIGKKCHKAIYNNDNICSWCYFEKLKNKEQKRTIIEVKRGNKFYQVNSILLDNSAKLTVYHDITKRKEAEQELTKAKDKAEESNRLKTVFINNMSHEIRTPLNGIYGFTGLLENPDLSEKKRKEYNGIVKDCGSRLINIVDDILEISTLETNKTKAYIESVCLNNLLSDMFSKYEDFAAENKTPLYLTKELSDEESTIYTNEIILTKALDHILENAFKFTNTGYVEFGYQLKDNIIELYVKDTGIGISSDKHELIFNRFTQVDKKIYRKYGGLGLGLSISKENIQLLEGNITVKSTEGRGSTFLISIPYKPVKIKKIRSNISIPEQPGEYIILIAEDDEMNYLYLEALLIEKFELKCKILHAKNGEEAVDICNNNSDIDLVLMDIKMPIMNGYEATKKIREFRKELPITALTAYAMSEDKERSKLAGCNDFITKPINEKILNSILNKYLILESNYSD